MFCTNGRICYKQKKKGEFCCSEYQLEKKILTDVDLVCLVGQVCDEDERDGLHSWRSVLSVLSKPDLTPEKRVMFISSPETERQSKRPVEDLLDCFFVASPPDDVFDGMNVRLDLINVRIGNYTRIGLCSKRFIVPNAQRPFTFQHTTEATIKIVEIAGKFHRNPLLVEVRKDHF